MVNRIAHAESQPPALMDRGPASIRTSELAPLLSILAASIVLAFPVIRYGLPYGHDSFEHLSWYKSFAAQLWSGEPYPRWLLGMNSGLGSPDLFVYGPIPYYVASVFRVFTLSPGNEAHELGMCIWIALGLSGVAAYLWLRDIVGGRLGPTIAAILYMALPYHLITDLYTRCALAEFWAFAWMPLIMYFTRRFINQRTTIALAGLAVSYALLVGTHLLTVLMFSAVPLLYACFLARPRDRGRALGGTVLGIFLGFALSAVYVLPALAYEKSISPYRLTATNPEKYSFEHNFLFSSVASAKRFTGTLSLLTAWTAGMTAGFFMILVLSKNKTLRREGMFWVIAAAVSFAMMLPITAWLWRMVPPLQAIWLPWRFNTVMALATAVLAALAMESLRTGWEWRKGTLAVGTFLMAIACIFPLSRSMGYQGPWVAKYESIAWDYLIPTWAQWTDPKLITTSGIGHIAQLGGDAKVFLDHGSTTVEKWEPRSIQFHVTTPTAAWVTVKQFYFPGWVALAGGQPLSISPSSPEGLIKLWVPAGENEIRLKMPHSPAEILGAVISGIAALVIFFLSWRCSSILGHSG